MTAALHTPQDSGVQRTSGTGKLNLRHTKTQRPREVPFSFASFLLGKQKKGSL